MTSVIEDALGVLEIVVARSTMKRGGEELWALCPGHKAVTGKADHKPSWSINTITGAHSCFSCGYKGNLWSLIQDVTGELPEDMIVEIRRQSMDRNLAKAEKRLDPVEDWEDEPEVYVSEVAYEGFYPVPRSQVEQRQLDPSLTWLYGVRWDRSEKAWVIPVRHPDDGHLLGWQLKRPGWFKNVPTGLRKKRSLFGLQQFRGQRAILVESPLDVIRLATLGYAGALASYGVQYSPEQMDVIVEEAATLIVALDNDSAGRALATKIKTEYGHRLPLKFLHYGSSKAKDVGDMSDNEVHTAIAQASAVHR